MTVNRLIVRSDFVAFLGALVFACPAAWGQSGAWELVWADEFEGSSIDTNIWNVRNAPGNTNNELQYYAPDEVSVSGGMLHLRSQRRSYGGRQYTSGLVETRRKFAQMYGRIEVRARLPRGQGIWPAHWLLPESGVWPPEIDIMELLGHQPTTVYMTNHWGVWPAHQYRTGSFTGPDFTQDYHTFAVEWTPTRIRWLVDGTLRFANNTGVPTGAPFYIILNTAVGGIWPGNPDATTVFPQMHDIEYVRVYTRADPGTPLQTITDGTAPGATVDGIIAAGEYAGQVTGINNGWGDRIGAGSRLHVDSDSAGRLYLGLDGVTSWPPAPVGDGVVMYVDSKPEGLTSTITINNAADMGRALTSGNAAGGGSGVADLYFADGFTADYAICFQDAFAGVYRLGHGTLEFVVGAALNAAVDTRGGTTVRYVRGTSDASVRELRIPLEDLEAADGGPIGLFGTMLRADTAQRSNEYMGVALGNWWDSVPSSTADVQLKQGDFVRFHARPRCLADWNQSGVLDSQDYYDFVDAFFGGHADFNSADGTDSQDFLDFLEAFFTGCD